VISKPIAKSSRCPLCLCHSFIGIDKTIINEDKLSTIYRSWRFAKWNGLPTKLSPVYNEALDISMKPVNNSSRYPKKKFLSNVIYHVL